MFDFAPEISQTEPQVLSKREVNLQQGKDLASGINEKIVASGIEGSFIIGGGVVYESQKYETEPVKDIDTMFLFKTREEMESFFTDSNAEKFAATFGFDRDRVDTFTSKEKEFAIQNGIEVIRVSGFIDGVKTTVKLSDEQTLSTEGFGNDRLVFSKHKDKRIYDRRDSYGNKVDVLLQNIAIRADDSADNCFVIIDKDYCQKGNSLVTGLITDFLVTSQSVEDDTSFSSFQQQQREKFVRVTACGNKDKTDWSANLVRGTKFSEGYRQKLNAQLSKTLQTLDDESLVETTPINRPFIVETIDLVPSPEMTIPRFTYKKFEKVEPKGPISTDTLKAHVAEGIEVLTGNHVVNADTLEGMKFSSNCRAGQAIDEKGNMYFFKAPLENASGTLQAEISGLQNLRQLYPRVQRPVFWTEDYTVIASPWINGDLQAVKLLEGTPNSQLAAVRTELQRSEELRKGYQGSMSSIQQETTVGQRVHELHFNRLTGQRFEDYYENSQIALPDGTEIDFKTLCEMTPIVNGVRCESLQTILDRSKAILNPQTLDSHVKVFGFGDNHAGNVMITSNEGAGDYINFDYEFAGVQPPELDMAKTLYNDVYGRMTLFGNDQIFEGLNVDVDNNTIRINYENTLNEAEAELLEIKLRGILFPTLDYAKSQGFETEHWEEILRSGMVTSGLLNKNVLNYNEPRKWVALALVAQLGTANAELTDHNFIFDKLISEYKLKNLINEIPVPELTPVATYFDTAKPLSDIFTLEHMETIDANRDSLSQIDAWIQTVGPENASKDLISLFNNSDTKEQAKVIVSIKSLLFSPRLQKNEDRLTFIDTILTGIGSNTELSDIRSVLDGTTNANVEVGHMMIKPEGLENFPEGIRSRLELELTSAGLEYVIVPANLNEFQARRIYPEDSVPQEYIQSLSENPTMQIIIRGPRANEVITQIKGKMVDSARIERGMTSEQISNLPGTGLRGEIKAASDKALMDRAKWHNFIHASASNEEALRFISSY